MSSVPQMDDGAFGSFGARLRATRLSIALPVEEIADQCHVNRVTWYEWEKGKTPRDMNALLPFAQRAKVPLAWLEFGKGPKPEHVTAEAPALRRGRKPGQKSKPRASVADTELRAALDDAVRRLDELEQLVAQLGLEVARSKLRKS